MNKFLQILSYGIFIFSAFLASAQKIDTLIIIRQPLHQNVIKFNPTPIILLYPKNVTFSYERILSTKQSISIELGYFGVHPILGDTLANLIAVNSQNRWGLNASLEYRFYLTKLNTLPVPAGLYIGPYLANYSYSTRNDMALIAFPDSSGMINCKYHAMNLGIEMGYQFIFGKRLTLDVILFGPSFSYSWGRTEVTGFLTEEQKQLLFEEIYNKAIEKYPVFKHNMTLLSIA